MSREIDLEEELARSKLSRRVMHRLWSRMRPHSRGFLFALAIEPLWVTCTLVAPYLIQKAIDGAIPAGDTAALAWLCLGFIAAMVLRALIAMLQIKLTMRAGLEFLHDLRAEVFTHVQRLSMRYFDRTRHGRIIARVDRDVESLERPVIWGPMVFTSCSFSIIGSLVLMFSYDAWLAIGVAALVPALLIVGALFKNHGLAAYRRVRESFTALTAHFAETIGGVRVIQAFVREDHNRGDLEGLLDHHNREVVKAQFIAGSYTPAMGLLYLVGTLLLLFAGGYRVLAGDLQIGELTAFFMLLGYFFRPIEGIGELYSDTLSAVSAAERIFLLLDTPPEVTDHPQAREIDAVAGEVRFESVEFTYYPRREDEPAAEGTATPGGWNIDGMSLRVPAGTTAAFVGHTGAGKSSIVNLVARFYDVTGGAVTIDGIDVRDLRQRSLHSHMGIVLQESFLFRASVLDNIKFARPEASDAEAITAARELGCDEVFTRLSDGYATDVGERGGNLSEGERQLVSFTRAMLADPQVLILDEATSAVDVLTEARIQHALEHLARGRTTFIVAHRLATIRRADVIFVLDQGRIVEQGTHSELLAAGGSYAALVHQYEQAGVVE